MTLRGQQYLILLDRYYDVINKVRPPGEHWCSDRDAIIREIEKFMRWDGKEWQWVNMSQPDIKTIEAYIIARYEKGLKRP